MRTGWGVSFFLDGSTLFDTGENGAWLLANMELMNIDIKKIQSVVISHDHWDHTGGLRALLERNPLIKVYGCPGFGNQFKQLVAYYNAPLVEIDTMTNITGTIFSTGEVSGMYKEQPIAEQALVVNGDRGIAIITGCAHPGIITIVKKVKKHFPDTTIQLVIGGFHLMQTSRPSISEIIDEMKDLGVVCVGPTHCSGGDAQEMFQMKYGENYVPVIAGESIQFQ
ncbi:MAG: MBL fold metallo-hydrolase [Chitinivibrionales bacterium]|nr:MBL fold metallo-hydrolase [Chitinivibrionales bacterium]